MAGTKRRTAGSDIRSPKSKKIKTKAHVGKTTRAATTVRTKRNIGNTSLDGEPKPHQHEEEVASGNDEKGEAAGNGEEATSARGTPAAIGNATKKPHHDYRSITPSSFTKLLHQYPSVVPAKLTDLDEERYTSIPQRLGSTKGNRAALTKDEVATLVDWKLSHGKFRPTLRALVQQNGESDVENTTSEAFASYSASPKNATDVKSAINTLAKLRGVGPATASLLLSVFDSETAPFFSDELYRWCMFEPGNGKGWDRTIKYNLKEYQELCGKVDSLRERFRKDHEIRLSAVDIEKVAYVLGKQDAS